jgi:hypothetical protein
MPTTEMIVMIAVIAALILGFIHLLRLFSAMILHSTVRRVVDRDPAAAEGLLAKLTEPRVASGDDRLSTILVAVGIAMIAGAIVAVDDPGVVRVAIGAALFPLFLGIALWLRLFILARTRRGTGQ